MGTLKTESNSKEIALRKYTDGFTRKIAGERIFFPALMRKKIPQFNSAVIYAVYNLKIS